MPDPIVFISRNRVKEGMLDVFRSHYRNSIPPVEANKPGTLVQLAYYNEKTAEVDIVRVFPDAAALDMQLQGADERTKVTYQYIEPTRMEIYGKPGEFALEMMKKVAGAGIEVKINPDLLGGFIRNKP